MKKALTNNFVYFLKKNKIVLKKKSFTNILVEESGTSFILKKWYINEAKY